MRNQRFSKGDVAYLVNCVKHPKLNGRMVTVMSDYQKIIVKNETPFMGYYTNAYIGDRQLCVYPWQLKRIDPPGTNPVRNSPVSWDSLVHLLGFDPRNPLTRKVSYAY